MGRSGWRRSEPLRPGTAAPAPLAQPAHTHRDRRAIDPKVIGSQCASDNLHARILQPVGGRSSVSDLPELPVRQLKLRRGCPAIEPARYRTGGTEIGRWRSRAEPRIGVPCGWRRRDRTAATVRVDIGPARSRERSRHPIEASQPCSGIWQPFALAQAVGKLYRGRSTADARGE